MTSDVQKSVLRREYARFERKRRLWRYHLENRSIALAHEEVFVRERFSGDPSSLEQVIQEQEMVSARLVSLQKSSMEAPPEGFDFENPPHENIADMDAALLSILKKLPSTASVLQDVVRPLAGVLAQYRKWTRIRARDNEFSAALVALDPYWRRWKIPDDALKNVDSEVARIGRRAYAPSGQGTAADGAAQIARLLRERELFESALRRRSLHDVAYHSVDPKEYSAPDPSEEPRGLRPPADLALAGAGRNEKHASGPRRWLAQQDIDRLEEELEQVRRQPPSGDRSATIQELKRKRKALYRRKNWTGEHHSQVAKGSGGQRG
jgi:ATP-dependent Clp protease ATP-binding subunit ClpA